MRRGVSGYGFVILILVGACVVYLALKSLESVQPTAREINEPVFAGEQVLQDSGGVDRGAPAPPPIRPSVHEARQKTAAHTERVRSTLGQTD